MKTEFPMKIRTNEAAETKFYDSTNSLRLIMMDSPAGDFRARCVEMMKATWADAPQKYNSMTGSPDMLLDTKQQFEKILRFKVLPNSLESLHFQFRVEGLTLVEVTHLLRHRMFSSIHAQCSADRFLQKDSAFIPSSILNSTFAARYKKLTEECKELYADMVYSEGISLLDARYILNRNHRYFYYFGCNLKDAIAFINQRKCTGIQPELDNIFAQQMYEHVTHIIPELKDIVHMNCGPNCFYVTSDGEDSSRVNYPDPQHTKLIKDKYGPGSERLEPEYYLMGNKTRKDVGIKYQQETK